jgi:hypothetical protein
LFTDQGDEDFRVGACVKTGGGATYSGGRSYLFNNTMVTRSTGIGGGGYGYDKNRALFKAFSRNNVICAETPVCDPEKCPENDFDCDLISGGPLRAAPNQETHAVTGAPTFRDPAADDYRLADGSRGKSVAVTVPNFSLQNAGKADMGAFDDPALNFLPYRPIPLVPDRTRVTLTADLGKQTATTAKVVIAVKAGMPWTKKFRIVKNDAFAWIAVSPASGEFNEGASVEFTVTLDKEHLTPGVKRGIFLVRLEDGYSVPVSCSATVVQN